jgi:hypothetical protein
MMEDRGARHNKSINKVGGGMIEVNSTLFKLGRVVATPAALDLMESSGVAIWSLVARHVAGDFGDVDAHDRQANQEAIRSGERILSSYVLPNQEKVWVLTEADRSSTCVMTPYCY